MWTTFPTFHDIDLDGTGDAEASVSLAALSYGAVERSLPEDPYEFFRVQP